MFYILDVEALKRVIREKNLTDDELAEFFNVRKQTVKKYLGGKSQPTIIHLNIFCRKVGIETAELIKDKQVGHGKI